MRPEAFLNGAEFIERCRGARYAPRPTDGELERGIPLFLVQLIATLRLHKGSA